MPVSASAWMFFANVLDYVRLYKEDLLPLVLFIPAPQPKMAAFVLMALLEAMPNFPEEAVEVPNP